MTDGTTRRKELMKMLQHETKPLSGTELAKHFGVSRQVIVQDIALLRATDRNILSTNKGMCYFTRSRRKNAAEGFLRPITGKNGCRKNCI